MAAAALLHSSNENSSRSLHSKRSRLCALGDQGCDRRYSQFDCFLQKHFKTLPALQERQPYMQLSRRLIDTHTPFKNRSNDGILLDMIQTYSIPMPCPIHNLYLISRAAPQDTHSMHSFV